MAANSAPSGARPGLSQPGPLTRATTVTMLLAGSAFLVLVAVVYANGKLALTAVPAMGTVHAGVMLAICSTIALLVLTHARFTGERGYLVLGGTFAYVAGVMALFPFVYPNGIIPTDPPSTLLGNLQSSATLFHPWHLALIVGVTWSAVLLGRDRRSGRRPTPGQGTKRTLGVVLVLLLLTGSAVTLGADYLPVVVEGIQATEVALVGFRIEVLLALAGTVVVAYECRDGSSISRWLLAVMIVTLGEAVTMLNADRYSLAWYYNRVIGLLAALILLFVLIRSLGKVERDTSLLLEHDSLTGAFSRAATLAEIGRELLRARATSLPLTLAWVDIDGFKEINEQAGQAPSDRILTQMRSRLSEASPADSMVGRMGGDEFAIVLVETSEQQAADAATAVLAALREPFDIGDSPVSLSVSLGLAKSDVGDDAELLARKASMAMLAAKDAGGDRVQWFSSDLVSGAVQRARLRQDLTEAIRHGDFAMAYQPIVNLESGLPAGVEALVRWVRDGQRHSAGSFINFAEESGQIVAIGRQVVSLLEFEVPAILESAGPEFMLTFNLSVKELADSEILDRLTSGPLAAHAAQLVVEVTESFELGAASSSAENLGALRQAGYRLAIDDFGAGFSNFVRLADLNPAIVKIDRSLVVQAGAGSTRGLTTLSAALDVARAFGARTLAEGLETNDEAEVCVRLGVELAQGYRYARGMALDPLQDYLASRLEKQP